MHSLGCSPASDLGVPCADLTEQTRLDFYKLVYFEAESSFQEGGPLQGLLFWRWNAVQNVDLGTSGVPGSSAQTVNTDSPTFQQVPVPCPLLPPMLRYFWATCQWHGG